MERKASANPTKAFFVRMITRDISLEDCILDLIDNSVDAAWQRQGARPMSLGDKTKLTKYKIEIEAQANLFTITDNCGGITLDDAAEYAFTFGRRDDDPHEKYSIGVYGIGMKRAIFKLGTKIKIRSTYENKRGKTEAFAVPIDVKSWLEDTEASSWDFDIESDKSLESPGVKIQVSTLTGETATSFSDPAFVQRLRRTIARDYTLHLHRGLTISVNGENIQGWSIEMREGSSFAPMRISYKDKVQVIEDDKTKLEVVNVEILAGMAAPPPETTDPDEKDPKESRSGWYVACNGRIVLAANKTDVAGWSTDDWPKWHPQYEGFLGLVLFSSENAKLLPLTTTKRSVDTSSAVYRAAMPRMRDVSKNWIAYTNLRRQALEQAKTHEEKAKPITIYEIKARETVRLPQLAPKPKRAMTTIAYAMTPKQVRTLADALGDIGMTNRDVGIKSFKYTYEDLVGDE
jgi:hypothetical protein